MKIESELVQKLKDKAFQTENDKLLVKSFEIEREKQLTAVEWLEEQINPYAVSVHKDLFEQAKEMEKEKMIEFACQVAEASAMKYIQGKTTWQIAEELLTKQQEQ